VETQLECIRQCLELLPPGNRSLLCRLVAVLQVVAQNKEETKMDSRNLAIVFAPILLRPPADKNSQDQSYIASLLGDSMHAYKLMEIFIVHYNDLLGTTKPACKMKIRHSLTPAQQAAFYRTLKEGMVKVEQALIL